MDLCKETETEKWERGDKRGFLRMFTAVCHLVLMSTGDDEILVLMVPFRHCP